MKAASFFEEQESQSAGHGTVAAEHDQATSFHIGDAVGGHINVRHRGRSGGGGRGRGLCVCVCVCVRACMRACVRVRTCVDVCTCKPVFE